MQFIKTRDVKNPVRNADENAGIDFYVPAYCYQFRYDLLCKNAGMKTPRNKATEFFTRLWCKNYIDNAGVIHVAPGKDVIIPTGIRSKFDNNLALIANNKSGIATKKKLVFGASVIDASYQGEWHAHMINTSHRYQIIECDQKIVQFIPHLISTAPIEVLNLTPEEFYTVATSRGEGWAGSTGTN
jgi:dUTPase